MLSPGQARTVRDTLALALADAAGQVPSDTAEAIVRAAELLSPSTTEQAARHPALPAEGACEVQERQVTTGDTAAALGHPDAAVDVLASPRLALWFELASSALLPRPSERLSHVGVGIVVHHLGTASVGECVSVRAALHSAHGRHALFVCSALVGARLVAVGTHHRVLLERS